MKDMKRVFIGGMGRSGTTITLHAFYQHGQLFSVPIETKFLVEADGFYDLLNALTNEYSPAYTPYVIKRFERLMRKRVTGIEPFESFTEQSRFSSELFEHYEKAVDDMMNVVLYRSFYSEREPVLNAMRRFIFDTFDYTAIVSNKAGWVEKTPASFWRLEFLRELYPNSYFVHVIRDPRWIMCSLMEKGWISRDTVKALTYFEAWISAFVLRRREVMRMPRVVEIRLETLQAESSIVEALIDISNGLSLEPFTSFAVESTLETIKKYSYSKDKRIVSFTQSEAFLINQALMPWVLELGYSPDYPEFLITK
jgi:hypothetical protein